MTEIDTICRVCGGHGKATAHATNGLPKGVVICPDCRDAVKLREVGIVERPDGSLHVTDAR